MVVDYDDVGVTARTITTSASGAGGDGTWYHNELFNLDYDNSGHTGFASQDALDEEKVTRHEEITTAVTEEAEARQAEIDNLNDELEETNRVLSGKVTQTLSTVTLNTEINGQTAVAKEELSPDIPLIAGGSWVNDLDGTLGVYVGDLNENTAIIRTKTTSAKDHAQMDNLDYDSSGHTGFTSREDFDGAISWLSGMQVQPLPDTLSAQGSVGETFYYPYADFTEMAELAITVAPLKTIFFDTVGNLLVYLGDWSNPRALQWHIDNETDLYMRRVTIVSSGGTSDHSALANLSYETSGHTGFASQDALDEEKVTRHEEITTAVTEEAEARQAEIDNLNNEIEETNRVLSGKVTQTLYTVTLSKEINGQTAIAKSELASSIPLIAGGSWANDLDGTLAIYAGDLDEDTAIFRTKTTTGVKSPDGSVLTMKYTENAADPMENGEVRFVSDPNFDPEPYNPATAMVLIPNPDTEMVLVSDEKGQAIESDLAISDIAKLQDRFAMRLSSGSINVTIANGNSYQLLQNITMGSITLSANLNPSDWAINTMTGANPGVAMVFPAFEGWVDYSIDVRLTGTCAISGNVTQEFSISLQRQNANTTAIAQSIMVSGNSSNLTMKSLLFRSYTANTSDPFIQGGVQLRLNNTMGGTITLTQVDVIINGSILTRG